MKKIYALLLFTISCAIGYSQISINTTGSAFTEDFNSMGTTAIATLPTGFKVGTDWATGVSLTGLAAGTSGTGALTGTSSGNIYNYANGVTASSTDRALGFLTSGGFSSPRSIIVKITNNTGANITSLTVSFDYEKYRAGTRVFDWTFFHGNSSTATTAEILGNQNYVADAANAVVNPPTTINKSISLTGLAIANGSDYYLRWTYTGLAGSTNSQGLAIDNFSITATGGADILPPTVTTLTPADNATNVSLSTNLQILFNEPIVKGTGNIVLKRSSDNSIVETIDVTTAAVVVAGSTSTITINPLLNLSDYYVEIAAGAFTDIALNAYAGITGATTWNFTTLPVPAAGTIGNNYTFTNCATTFLNEGWSQFSVASPQTWVCSTTGRTDVNGIQMNAFVSAGNNPLNEDWLISPAFDLTAASLPTLKFYSRGDFTGNSLQLKVSTNYVAGTNPSTATWTDLAGNFPANVAGTGVWTLSDNIDLSVYNTTNVRLAWVYINPSIANSSRWTIDDVTVYSSIVLPPCDEPTVQPTNLALTPTATTVTGIFTAVAPAVTGYLVVRSTSSTLSATPADATTYTVGQSLGGAVVVANSAANSFTDIGLTPLTVYYYFVFAYNDESCTGGPNYLSTLNPAPTGNTNTTTTLALAACIEPGGIPGTINLSPTNTSISGNFTGVGIAPTANRYLVIISTSNSLSTTPVDGTTYTVGAAFGGGTVVSYGAALNFTATGLIANTPYYFYVFAANGDCTGEPDYFNTGSSNGTASTTIGTGAPTTYYDPANGLTCQPLKSALKTIIATGTQVLSYTPGLWTLYTFSDKRRNDANNADIVWDMYSDNPTGPEPYTYTLITNQCGSYTVEGNCYNREHSTPQSWFNQVSPMVSDAHHIFPTDGKVNALHSNYPYGEVITLTTLAPSSGYTNPTQAGSKLGTGTNFGYSGTIFEPINEYKGDFARAALYMAVRYEDEIISQNWSGLGTANAVFLSTTDQPTATTRRLQIYDDWYLKTLYKWHMQDPVSQKEIDRNNVIFAQEINDGGTLKKQGNRNPFIDHPEYVFAIWGSSCLSVLPVTIVNFTAQKNNNTIALNWKVANEINVKQYEVERSIDGINFNLIGALAGSNITNYSFIDKNLPNGAIVYYRLKMIDQDGKFKNSNIVSVKLKTNVSNAIVYPNPTMGSLNIKLYDILTSNSTLQITDVTGRLVKQQTINASMVNINVDVKGLPTGRYFIKISTYNQVINLSFVAL